jgi:hypothetical protein
MKTRWTCLSLLSTLILLLPPVVAAAGADGFVRIRDGRFATESGRLKI